MTGNISVPNTGGGGAPTTSKYVLTEADSNLPDAIVFDPGTDSSKYVRSDGAGGLAMDTPAGGGSGGTARGQATLTAGTATVSDPSITTDAAVNANLYGGFASGIEVFSVTVTPSVGFVITSSNPASISIVSWIRMN